MLALGPFLVYLCLTRLASCKNQLPAPFRTSNYSGSPTAIRVTLVRQLVDDNYPLEPTGVEGQPQSLAKRDAIPTPIPNLRYDYGVNFPVGNPVQTVRALLDTGSASLWFYDPNSPACAETSTEESYVMDCTDISFDPDLSSTFDDASVNAPSTDFVIYYGGGGSIVGSWGADNIAVGDVELQEVPFAVAEKFQQTTPAEGTPFLPSVFGVGFPVHVALDDPSTSKVVINGDAFEYANIPMRLYLEGRTAVWAYSIWYNDLTAEEGELVFGGVDHAKYTGVLTGVPMIDTTSVAVVVNAISLRDIDGLSAIVSEEPLSVVIDSGTSLMYMWPDVADSIAATLGCVKDGAGYNNCPCYAKTGQSALQFNFGGVEVSVEFYQFLYELYNSDGSQLTNDDGEELCRLRIGYRDGLLIGNAFLRSIYVYYDLGGQHVYMAQAIHSATDSDIETVTNTPSGATFGSDTSTSYHTSILSGAVTPTGLRYASVSTTSSSTSSSVSTTSSTTSSSATTTSSATSSSTSTGSGDSVTSSVTSNITSSLTNSFTNGFTNSSTSATATSSLTNSVTRSSTSTITTGNVVSSAVSSGDPSADSGVAISVSSHSVPVFSETRKTVTATNYATETNCVKCQQNPATAVQATDVISDHAEQQPSFGSSKVYTAEENSSKNIHGSSPNVDATPCHRCAGLTTSFATSIESVLPVTESAEITDVLTNDRPSLNPVSVIHGSGEAQETTTSTVCHKCAQSASQSASQSKVEQPGTVESGVQEGGARAAQSEGPLILIFIAMLLPLFFTAA